MYLPPKDTKNACKIRGIGGLPEGYPVPEVPDMLFYIQRNQNINTVIYQLNRNLDGNINLGDPINIFWKNYASKVPDSQINYIQRKLAYGLEYQVINEDTIQMHIISYPQYQMYVTKNDQGIYKAVGKIADQWAELSNVYVYANEEGAFPVVKYLELYGLSIDTMMPCYQKIEI